MRKRKGTITATTQDGTEYLAEIYEKKCACSSGLQVVPVSKQLAFVRGLLPAVAADEIRERGWAARIDYDR